MLYNLEIIFRIVVIKNTDYIKTTLKFWKYKKGSCTVALRSELSKLLGVKEKKVFVLENGRTGQYLFLKSLDLPSKYNVALQGFTCNAVVNPILWLGLEPLYIDIDPMTLNMSFDSLNERIDEKTKVVILQHTFGNPAFKTKKEFNDFVSNMHEKGILVIEDCAHALGGEVEGKKLGTFGDAAIFSFGIEKVLSTRVGGALVINNEEFLKDFEGLYKNVNEMGYFSTFVWLINPFLWRVLRVFKCQMKIAQFLRKIKILNMGFEDSELVGKKPKHYPRKLSNALSCVALDELKNLDANLSHRKQVSDVYGESFSVEHLGGAKIPFVKFPIVCETKQAKKALKEFLEKNNVKVGNWYEPVIYPESTVQRAMKYKTGGCKIAEIISSRILNLPTGRNISEKEAREISEKITSFLDDYESRGDI